MVIAKQAAEAATRADLIAVRYYLSKRRVCHQRGFEQAGLGWAGTIQLQWRGGPVGFGIAAEQGKVSSNL